MTWLVAVLVLVAGCVAGIRLLAHIPGRPAGGPTDPDRSTDAAAHSAHPTWVPTTAVVTGITQDGMSRGVVLHRCRLDLEVRRPEGATAPATVVTDLELSILAHVLPGFTVDVLVDPDGTDCALLPGATRARATGRAELPPVGCRGIPDHVFLRPDERRIEQARSGTAVIACLDIDSPHRHLICNTTLGLWVDDTTATRVSERFSVVQLVPLSRGSTLPVEIDPADATRVVVDARSAVRALAGRLPGPEDLRAALDSLGVERPVGVLRSMTTTKGRSGVRYRVVARGDVVAADGSTRPFECTLLRAIPEIAPLVPGSAVVLGPEAADGTRPVDLESTNRARARAAQSAIERR